MFTDSPLKKELFMKTQKQTYSFLVTLALSCLILSHAQAQFIQQGNKLVGTGAVGSARQGVSVSISADGNTAIVGGAEDNSEAGAAWVYTQSAGVWTQQGSKLVGTGAVGNAQQGVSVSLSADGNTAIVGGGKDNGNAGAAWVYTRGGGVWAQQGSKLVGTGAVGNVIQQGVSVSLSADGNTAIVGGLGDNSLAGASWVFTRSGGVWTQQGSKLVGTDAVGDAHQGISVSLSADGNTAIVGGPGDNSQIGAAWVYTRSGGVWTQQGSKLVGTGAVGNADQGYSASLSADGNTAIIGGVDDNSQAGAAWVYTRSGGVWTQQGSKLVGTGGVGGSWQGISVSLSANGNTTIVGGFNDNGYAGAAWVYTRSAGVWTQQGSKFVGTGAVGGAQQGCSVFLSADGNTAIVGGEGDSSYAGAVWLYYVPSSLIITGVTDVVNDQGGQVRLKWKKSSFDDPLSTPQVSSYSVFRKSSSGTSARPKALPLPTGIAMDSALLGYDYVASIPAFQLPNYQTVVPTLEDSTSTGSHFFYFRIVAQTSDLNRYYVSNIDSGYSVDNLAPIPPAGLVASVQSGPQVQLTWNQPTDPDVGSYVIYRSTTNGFAPAPSNSIGTAFSTSFTDGNPVAGAPSYYRIIAVDVHDNRSLSSAQAQAKVTVTQQFSVQNSWNMVSVPLTVSDYAKARLFSTAVSNAFAYDGSYAVYGTLKNGRGYWLKFSSSQAISMEGLDLVNDTVKVAAGWNMIGSLTASISVGNIGSNPGGIVTSNFFGFNGSYQKSTTIEPGLGYWVKVSQAGQLVLSSTGNIPSANRIHIENKGELPPPAPTVVASGEPETFMLGQNYPNPFNPTTTIEYDLPRAARISLKIYDAVGREVVTLMEGVQEAGFKTFVWDASAVPSGVYMYQLIAKDVEGNGTFNNVRKMILLK